MSRYSWSKCQKSQPTTKNITPFLENIIDTKSFAVEQIVSDTGTQFTSQEYTQWAESKNIRISKGSVYDPQTDDETEQAKKTWITKVKISTAQNMNHWYQNIAKATLTINKFHSKAENATLKNVSLNNKENQIIREIKNNIQIYSEKIKAITDKSRKTGATKEIGNKVLEKYKIYFPKKGKN
jgi:hypothetical protein